MSYSNPTPTVDVIVQEGSKVLMVRRKKEPFKGCFALPGGFVNTGETVEDAAKREVWEETLLEIEPTDILGVYSDPARDPRGHALTVVFVAAITGGKEQAGDDAASLEWVSLVDLEKVKSSIAFDHEGILADYLKWKDSRGTFWSTKRRV